MQETSNLGQVPIEVAPYDITSQIGASRLSKQGKTTLTGIFEGVPENLFNARRGTTIPNNSPETVLLYSQLLGTQKAATTYLDHLKQEKEI